MAVSFTLVMVAIVTFLRLPKYHAMEMDLQIQCETDKQCNVNDSDDYKCVENVCICLNPDECQEANSIADVPVAKIGGSCSKNEQCLMGHSFCSAKKKCECIKNTVKSSNSRKCLTVSTHGSDCEEDVQCGTFDGVCLDRKCTCDKSKHFTNKMCYNNAKLGSSCQTHEECSDTIFSVCKEGKCTCLPNYVASSSTLTCLPEAKTINSKCLEDVQCSTVLGSGAGCVKGSCKCRELHQFKKDSNNCTMDILLGGKCSKHDECHQPGEEPDEKHLECVLGECKCRPLYTEKSGFCILNSAEGSTEISSISKLFPYILSYILFLTVF